MKRRYAVGWALVALLVSACDMGISEDYDFVADAMTITCNPVPAQAQGQQVPGFSLCQTRAGLGATKAVNAVRFNMAANAAVQGTLVQFAPANAVIQQGQTTLNLQQQPLQNGVATFTTNLTPVGGAGAGGGQGNGQGQGQAAASLQFLVRVTAANAAVPFTATTASYDAGVAQQGQQAQATLVVDLTPGIGAPPQQVPPQQPQPPTQVPPGGVQQPPQGPPPQQNPGFPQQQPREGGCSAGGSAAGFGALGFLLLGLFSIRRRPYRRDRSVRGEN